LQKQQYKNVLTSRGIQKVRLNHWQEPELTSTPSAPKRWH